MDEQGIIPISILNLAISSFIGKNKPFMPFYFRLRKDWNYFHSENQKTMNPTTIIRKENQRDHNAVFELIQKAFESLEISEHNEGQLVQKLRKAPTFIEDLSLVAELNNQVVGHILFTPMVIDNGDQKFQTLILAPVSVFPEFQKMGIGGQLIVAGHQKAIELGFQSAILLGHPEYYPRFGYRPASSWGIKTQIPLPSDDVFMAVELTKGGLSGVSGMAVFPLEFGE
jgi:predicted N-acetyltransferase YhbS